MFTNIYFTALAGQLLQERWLHDAAQARLARLAARVRRPPASK